LEKQTETILKLSSRPRKRSFFVLYYLKHANPMELTVVAIKREDCLYHFDHPHNDTVEELLLNGTEEAID